MLLNNSVFFRKSANGFVVLYIHHFSPPLKRTFSACLLPTQLAGLPSFSFALRTEQKDSHKKMFCLVEFPEYAVLVKSRTFWSELC